MSVLEIQTSLNKNQEKCADSLENLISLSSIPLFSMFTYTEIHENMKVHATREPLEKSYIFCFCGLCFQEPAQARRLGRNAIT